MEWAWIMGWLLIILGSLVSGVVVTLLVEWYIFQKYLTTLPPVLEENSDLPASEFTSLPTYNLPEALTEALRNSGLGLPGELLDGVKGSNTAAAGDGCCLALNLIVQFVFRELRTSDMVRRWFLKKLNLEFEELVTRTTTGKLFERVSIKDIDLGVEAPVIRRAWVRDAHLHTPQKSQLPGTSQQSPLLDSLEVGLSLLYAGGFRIVTRANMVLGRTAHLSIEVRRLSGECVLCFRRRPYAHWSLAFVGEPLLDLNVHSLFQGRSLSQVSTLITGQIRKALRKKHTLPNFKMRHKPFLPRDECVEEEGPMECGGIPNGIPAALEVAVLEASRLPDNPLGGSIQITLALDCAAWVHLTQTGSSTTATIDLKVNRGEGLSSTSSLKPSLTQPHQASQIKISQQPLGLVFHPIQADKRGSSSGVDHRRSVAVVVIDSVVQGSPCAIAGVLPGDALISIDGKKITSLSQAARILKNAGETFIIRVERRSRLSISGLAGSASASMIGKNADKALDHDSELPSSISLPTSVPMSSSLPSSPAPKRGKVDNSISSAIGPTVVMSQLCAESDVSSSLSPSIPEISPAVGKRSPAALEEPSGGMRRNRSSSLPKSRSAKAEEGEGDVSGSKALGEDRKPRCTLQMKSTRELIPDEVIAIGEVFTFHINERHRFMNINVWGLSSPLCDKKSDDPGTPVDGLEITKAVGSISPSGSGLLRQRRRSSDPHSNSSMSSSSSSSSLSAGGKGLDSSLLVNEDGDKTKILLARLSVPIHDLLGIKNKEERGELERHIRCWSLQPPDPFSSLGSKFSEWTPHSGFDPYLCFGDILLRVSFAPDSKPQTNQQTTASVKSFAKRGWRSKQEKEALPPEIVSPSKELDAEVEEDDAGEKLIKESRAAVDESSADVAGHDFVRTQFHRATLCDFCGKKIWLKDAVQCRRCSMACHKKCVTKCQSVSRCSFGGQRHLSSLMTPEIVTTVEGPSEEEEDDDADVEEGIDVDDYGADGDSIGAGAGSGTSSRPSGTPTPQRIRTGLGGLLASVAAAASHQASRGLRRAGSAQNLAPGGAQGGSPASSATNVTPSPTAPSPPSTPSLTLSPSPNSPSSNSASTPSLLLLLSRSLPPSPQHSPTVSRKTSLAESPFHLPAAIRKSKAKSDSSCEVITATDSDGITINCLDETANKISFESDILGNEDGENLSVNKEDVDDEGELVQEAMDRLLQQHPRLLLQSREDEEAAMGEAKAAGRSLFSSLSPKKRREKIGKMIAKIEYAMDQEVRSRHDGGAEGGRGQVLSILMLHACSGLQHAQDEEEKERLRELKEAAVDSKEQEPINKLADENPPPCNNSDI